MNDVTNSSIHVLSGAYVVDALDDAEREAFERHLPGCHDCRVEVASLREAAAALADESALAPPASLRADVLAGIKTIRPLPPETHDAETGADAEAQEAPVAEVVPLRRRFRLATLAAAAAVLAVVGIGAVVESTRDDAGTSQLPVADRVMAADDATHVKVHFSNGGSATVFRSVRAGKAVLVTESMAQAPSGKVYELWLRSASGDMVPAGLVTSGGDHKQVFDGDATAAKAAAITIEPAGGSKAPTSEPIANFDFADA